MIFDDVQAGDEILVRKRVPCAYTFRSRAFWVTKKVDRVTKTQVIIGSQRYKRENGRLIGTGSYTAEAVPVGYVHLAQHPGGARDQTKEMRQFKEEVRRIKAADEAAELFIRRMRSGMSHEEKLELIEKGLQV